MKNKSGLKAIFMAMFSLLLIAQQSIAQRTSRDRSQYRNIARYNHSRRPMIINRYGYQPRLMPYGRRTRLPLAYTRIAFRGRPFYYTNGLYYANYGNYYGLVSPPFGLTL